MSAPLQFTFVDAQMRVRGPNFPDQDSCVAAASAALLLVEDTAFGIVQILSGRPAGSENYDSLTDTSGVPGGFFFPPLEQLVPADHNFQLFPTPFRYLKVGEVRYVGSQTTTFVPLSPPDGQKRTDA